MATNLGPILTGVAALLGVIFAAIKVYLPGRPVPAPAGDPDEPGAPAAAAIADVEFRIEQLHGTIRDLEEQLRVCRRSRTHVDNRNERLLAERDELQLLLGKCRLERQLLLEQIADDQGEVP